MTSTARFQREADVARVGLAETLGQLRDGVAPSALSGEALALVKDGGLGLFKALADQARANPVPALLIGAGLTMLLTRTTGREVLAAATSTVKSATATGAEAARKATSKMASAASGAAGAAEEAVADAAVRAADSAAEAALAAGGRVTGTVASAGETLAAGVRSGTDAVDTAKDRLRSSLDQGKKALDARRQRADEVAGKLSGQAQSMAEEARQSIARLIDEQPIVMAALSAALGATVGAVLPLSEAEKDLLGETGAKAIGAGRDALSGAAEVVRQEVSSADIGARMGEIADKLVHNLDKDAASPR